MLFLPLAQLSEKEGLEMSMGVVSLIVIFLAFHSSISLVYPNAPVIMTTSEAFSPAASIVSTKAFFSNVPA